MPISTSIAGIHNLMLNFSKKNKTIVPFHQIVGVMGKYWFDPEIRHISYM